ncbi:MITA [Mytilus edulis]|uniref:TMEM173 n=1 Tax=Mytilus edulis TaxID=6550 RepID=A0A8S3PQS6_MYTED|nr:MITA [Mytilus edulis]
MTENTSYFISYSNMNEDRHLVNEVVIPKLREKGITIYDLSEIQPVNESVLSIITSLVDKADKTLLFISENSLGSSWCSFEMLISLEKSQRTNRLAVVLLLHKIEESQLPHVAVLQEARKIHFDEQNDEWVREVVTELREKKTIGDIMPAGNVAHGLVWFHYAEFLQYVLPELEKTVKESDWYNSLTDEVKTKVSFKLYELVPRTCAIKYDIPNEDNNIRDITTFHIGSRMRSGNHRDLCIKMYSINIDQEILYCMCEYPDVIGTLKAMADNYLAKFSHPHKELIEERGFATADQFTTNDKQLQLDRFYYTMNSVLNHFPECINTARVLLFNGMYDRSPSKLFILCAHVPKI